MRDNMHRLRDNKYNYLIPYSRCTQIYSILIRNTQKFSAFSIHRTIKCYNLSVLTSISNNLYVAETIMNNMYYNSDVRIRKVQ